MERTLLYYPTIELPKKDWLRQALLYTDKVASILPFKNHNRYPETVKYLSWKGEYTPIYIEDVIKNNEKKFKDFENEFLNQIENGNILDEKSRRFDSPKFNGIFINKMTSDLIFILQNKGLISNRTNEKIFLNENVAIFYMAGLARFTANTITDKFIIPSTDYTRFSDIAFESYLKTERAYNLIFTNCLPVPESSVDLKDIVDFKKKHPNELKKFRQFVKDLIKEINNANDEYELKEYISSAKERIELEIGLLNNSLIKSKIKTVFTSLDALLGVENSKTFDTLFKIGLVSTPISHKIGTGMASIGLVGKLINNYFLKEKTIKELDYLFQAKKSGLLL